MLPRHFDTLLISLFLSKVCSAIKVIILAWLHKQDVSDEWSGWHSEQAGLHSRVLCLATSAECTGSSALRDMFANRATVPAPSELHCLELRPML